MMRLLIGNYVDGCIWQLELGWNDNRSRACEDLRFVNIQSIFEPRGPQAEQITELGWVLIVGGAVIFVVVVALTAYAILARAGRKQWLTGSGFVIGAGVVFPTIVLFALLVYTLLATSKLIRADAPAVRIEVIGEQWWWRVHYLDEKGGRDFVTANELHVPVGRSIEVVLKTADVIHSFWVPHLHGKIDMIPGRVNRMNFTVDRAGVSRGQCAEYCGGPHAQMALYVVASSPETFEQWRTQQRAAAVTPAKERLQRGQQLFLTRACAGCHVVRGTEAMGDRGPDLTHVGSRLSIGAGILPNNVGTIAGWIASSQHIKPGNLMPSFAVFSGEELQALAEYMASLK